MFVQTYVTRIDWHCPSENKQIVLKICSMSLNFVHWLKSMVVKIGVRSKANHFYTAKLSFSIFSTDLRNEQTLRFPVCKALDMIFFHPSL